MRNIRVVRDSKPSRKVAFWSNKIHKEELGKNFPIDYKNGRQVITRIHEEMINHFIVHKRPIQLRKTIGYMEMTSNTNFLAMHKKFTDWTKPWVNNKPVVRLNFETHGIIFRMNFRFSRYSLLRTLSFRARRDYKRKFAKRIFNDESF